MGLETGSYISALVSTNPTGSDAKSSGDDHIRFIKAKLLETFPNITGAVTASHTQLNFLNGGTISAIGFCSSVYALGTISTTLTLNPLLGNLQSIQNGGGTLTLVPPLVNCTMVLQMTNTASASVAVTSAFTKVDGTFTNINGDDFMCYITKIGSFTHLNIVALQ